MTASGKRGTYNLRGWLIRAMSEVQEDEELNDTEALHVLAKYGKFLRDASKDPGARVLIERDGQQIEVVFL